MPSLTTNSSPFIEQARSSHTVFIDQPYHLHSDGNHLAWRSLYSRMLSRWRKYANSSFQAGLDKLALDPLAVRRIDDVNKFLSPLSGSAAKPVSGYLPAYVFFDCRRQRAFPTTINIRDASQLDYLPEPDIFHDIVGHAPMHTDRAFADGLVRFGEFACPAAARVQSIPSESDRLHTFECIPRALARFF